MNVPKQFQYFYRVEKSVVAPTNILSVSILKVLV